LNQVNTLVSAEAARKGGLLVVFQSVVAKGSTVNVAADFGTIKREMLGALDWALMQARIHPVSDES